MDCVFGQADASKKYNLARLDGICGPDLAPLLRLTDVFEHPVAFLGRYEDEKLDQAFWDLGSVTLGVVYEGRIEWDLSHRLIRSFETLFRELYAVRCAPV